VRTTAFLLSVAVVVWAAFVVPLPYEQTVPGSVRPVEDLVTIEFDGEEINGDLALLTVRDVDATVVDALVAAFTPGEQLQPVDEQLPQGIDQQTMREIMAQQFANSFTTAVAVAAEAAGYDVDVSTEVVVVDVLADSAADGVLEPGDTIRALDGEAVTGSSQLVDLLVDRGEGDVVTLTIERDGEVLDVDVELAVLPATGNPGLGIIPWTLTAPVELPFDVQLAESNIIGPSAGLMIAVTVTDLLLEEDLAAGRVIAGTGTIDGTGAVGTIGSVAQKVEAAVGADADLMLVPAAQAEEAIEAADGRIEVVGVATLDEALDALR
jgi:PDZ domain-containing protein